MIDQSRQIESAISYIPAIDRELWVEIGMAVKSEMGDSGFDLWDRWSSQADSYNEKASKAVWKSIKPVGGIGIGTLFHYAKIEGWSDNGIRHTLTPEQIEARRQSAIERQSKQDAETAAEHRRAANKAKWILGQCQLEKHAYFDAKGFPNEIGNVWASDGENPILCIPMRVGKSLVGMQMIDIDGNKKFLRGQQTAQAEFLIDGKGHDWLVEGYATALSLKAALSAIKARFRIHVAFSAGNMKKLAVAYPTALVLADNDASGAGQRVAEETGCKWFMPPTVGQDFNDLHLEIGLFKASQVLRRFLMQNSA